MRDSTKRFSDRVENYVRYRPSYPDSLFRFLADSGLIAPNGGQFSAADVGAGTGIFTALLARRLAPFGGAVFAVEPNGEMRDAGIRHCEALPNVAFVPGTAENTGLPNASQDLVTVAQAFHWFNPERSVAEFSRILRPRGKLALVWNNRLSDTPFQAEYDRLVSTYAPEYHEVTHRNVEPGSLKPLFAGDWACREFDYEQRFDLSGAQGRALSSSYCPKEGEKGHKEIMEGIEAALGRFGEDGLVSFHYRTILHYGTPKRDF